MSIKLAINGLGRIGRLTLRALVSRDDVSIDLVRINGTTSPEDHIHLIKYDSTHGKFMGKIWVEREGEKTFICITSASGKTTYKALFTSDRDPTKLNWAEHNIDIVLECTGKFNSKEKSMSHISSGAKKVLVSAPCENADKTIVFGVNNSVLTKNDMVISIGSCTTNALAPIAKILNDNIGIEKGFMTTIHAYTNDQNILDGSHKDLRRARAAAVSIVPSSTGAAKALGLVLPELAGKLDGSAARVPVPNVSMVDLKFMAKRETSKDEVIKIIKDNAESAYKNIVSIAEAKLVSVDFNNDPHSSIFDPYETFVVGRNFVRVVAWYDNEYGFSERMVDVTKLAGGMI